MPGEPVFSVILPVFHGGELLRRSLAALRDLDYPADRFEVLVTGPAEGDGPRGIVEEAAAGVGFRLEYVASTSATRAGAINAAIAAAQGRYLAFADDDVFVQPDWLARLAEVFAARPEVGMVGGVDELTEDVGAFDLAFDAVLHSFLGSGRIRAGAGLRVGQYYPRLWNMALPRAVAMAAAIAAPDGRRQVFNAALTAHEDVELGQRVRRLGRAIVFAPEAKVRHRREITFAAMVIRDFKAGRTCRAEGLHPWPHRLLAGGLAGAAVLAVGAVFWAPLRVPLAVLAAAYAAILITLGILGAFRKRCLGVLVLAPVVAAGLHLARAAGYLASRKKKCGREESHRRR